MSEHTGVGECIEASAEEALACDWLALYRRRRWRQGDPLCRRRVRRRGDRREGVILTARYSCDTAALIGKVEAVVLHVEWDLRGDEKRRQQSTVSLLLVEVLDPAPLPDGVVHVRTVVQRGTKEQILERWHELGPLTGERLEAGERRYVEFDDQPMAYRRWRIVHISAPLTAEEASAIPSESPGAAARRRGAEDQFDERRESWAA